MICVFFRASLVPLDIPLGMLEYLRKEKHYVPWAEAERQISYLDVFLQETNAYDKFKVMYCSPSDNSIAMKNWEHNWWQAIPPYVINFKEAAR